ncbi:uncharacterized protein [Physcomitrium patens]|nr:centrosome-associated protein CEP250-like [Physcomitrium patens]|eukprot:XP_024375724.1 centrosome-associated protein CEP250-like [Physcomitrella patens]
MKCTEEIFKQGKAIAGSRRVEARSQAIATKLLAPPKQRRSNSGSLFPLPFVSLPLARPLIALCSRAPPPPPASFLLLRSRYHLFLSLGHAGLMAHHYYAACLDDRTTEFQNHSDLPPSSPAFRLRLSRLQQELAQFETRCVETRQALDSKTSEANAMKEHVCLLEGQLHQSEQTIAGVKEQLWGLEEEVAQLQADQVALQLQLELDSANHARDEEEWDLEREELKAQIAHLETELQLASCSDSELDFLITPAKKGHLDRDLISPGTLNGLSLQSLLDMGEASLEVEEDIHELKMRLAESEARERAALHELTLKDRELEELKTQNKNLKEEVTTEKGKAKEEAEDLTQEMAELRYQLMEMIEQERELRAQAEQASVLRVVELESQVKNARQEAVRALVSRRETEMQSDRLAIELQRVRLALKDTEEEVRELKRKLKHAQEEAEQCRNDLSSETEARLKLGKQLESLQAVRNSLVTENRDLKKSLDKAVATSSELAESLRMKESALHTLESTIRRNENEFESSTEDLSMEHVKSEGRISSEQLENQEDATSESLSTHDQLDAESSHITGGAT